MSVCCCGVADEAVSVMDVLHFYVPTIDQVSNGLRLALNLIRKYLPEGAFSRIYLDEQRWMPATMWPVHWRWKAAI